MLLHAHREAELKAMPLTFDSVAGFPVKTWDTLLPHSDFDRAAADLFSWKVQQRAGLKVAHGDLPLTLGSVVDMRLFGSVIPCRVTDIVDLSNEVGRSAGFTYSTLPGHPECGEESFLLTTCPQGIRFTITARSTPGRWWTKIGGPVAEWAQSAMVNRYLRTLD